MINLAEKETLNVDKVLEKNCEWLQANDRNGEFDLAHRDYLEGKIDLEVMKEIIINAYSDVLRGLDDDLDKNDYQVMVEIQSWIDEVKAL